MRGQGQYLDSGMNQMVDGQMHHARAQRLQHNSGMGRFPESADILQAEEECQYMSSKGGQWLSDRDGPKGSNVTPPHMYKEGEAKMEVGYEDNSLPQTFESLEQKFIHDIMKLTKEQQEAEDTENARHRVRLNEINDEYREKLRAMRARQGTCSEDILCRESQARHQKYQQESVKISENFARPSDALGFESYGEHANLSGAPRGQYPGGRAYNTGGRSF